MRRRAFLGGCGAVLMALLSTPTLAWAANETRVKFGLTDTILPGVSGNLLKVAARPFQSLLESATGMSGQVVSGGDALKLAKQLKDDKIQVGVFQGIEFAWARQANPKLEPVVICINRERTLKACLLVRGNSPFKAPADLRGKILAVPTETREHCKVFLKCKCVPASCTMKKFYKKVSTPADVEEALDDVVDGAVHAALVDGFDWAGYRKAKPGCAKRLRVLLASEPFPCAVIACQKGRFDADRVQRFRKALIAARDNRRGRELLQFLHLSGFEPIPDDYDRLFSKMAKVYPARK